MEVLARREHTERANGPEGTAQHSLAVAVKVTQSAARVPTEADQCGGKEEGREGGRQDEGGEGGKAGGGEESMAASVDWLKQG